MERLLECSFLIPMVRDGTRSFHSSAVWIRFHAALQDAFEGFSGPERFFGFRDVRFVLGEYTEGRTGRRVWDESRRYTIAIPESRVGILRKLLRRAACSFDQKCIYLSVAGAVEFVSAGPEDVPL